MSEETSPKTGSPDRDAISVMDIVAVLTQVMKEQQQTIDELAKRIQRLEGAGSRAS